MLKMLISCFFLSLTLVITKEAAAEPWNQDIVVPIRGDAYPNITPRLSRDFKTLDNSSSSIVFGYSGGGDTVPFVEPSVGSPIRVKVLLPPGTIGASIQTSSNDWKDLTAYMQAYDPDVGDKINTFCLSGIDPSAGKNCVSPLVMQLPSNGYGGALYGALTNNPLDCAKYGYFTLYNSKSPFTFVSISFKFQVDATKIPLYNEWLKAYEAGKGEPVNDETCWTGRQPTCSSANVSLCATEETCKTASGVWDISSLPNCKSRTPVTTPSVITFLNADGTTPLTNNSLSLIEGTETTYQIKLVGKTNSSAVPKSVELTLSSNGKDSSDKPLCQFKKQADDLFKDFLVITFSSSNTQNVTVKSTATGGGCTLTHTITAISTTTAADDQTNFPLNTTTSITATITAQPLQLSVIADSNTFKQKLLINGTAITDSNLLLSYNALLKINKDGWLKTDTLLVLQPATATPTLVLQPATATPTTITSSGLPSEKNIGFIGYTVDQTGLFKPMTTTFESFYKKVTLGASDVQVGLDAVVKNLHPEVGVVAFAWDVTKNQWYQKSFSQADAAGGFWSADAWIPLTVNMSGENSLMVTFNNVNSFNFSNDQTQTVIPLIHGKFQPPTNSKELWVWIGYVHKPLGIIALSVPLALSLATPTVPES